MVRYVWKWIINCLRLPRIPRSVSASTSGFSRTPTTPTGRRSSRREPHRCPRGELSVFTGSHTKRSCESVNEEIKELVFVDFTVCLLAFVVYTSASRPLNLQPL